jgi:hypothetical protein
MSFYSRNFSLLSFLRKIFSLFFSLLSLFSALSFLFAFCTSPPPIRQPPHGHGLKEIPPRWPRREGETTPACRGGLPWRSLPVWRSPTAKPAAVACRARSLPVWRSPTAKPAAVACRARSPPVWRSPTAKPAAWGRQACRLGY